MWSCTMVADPWAQCRMLCSCIHLGRPAGRSHCSSGTPLRQLSEAWWPPGTRDGIMSQHALQNLQTGRRSTSQLQQQHCSARESLPVPHQLDSSRECIGKCCFSQTLHNLLIVHCMGKTPSTFSSTSNPVGPIALHPLNLRLPQQLGSLPPPSPAARCGTGADVVSQCFRSAPGNLLMKCWPRLTCRACRLRVLSSALMPPERKWIPGTAPGMVRSMVRTVYFATSSGEAEGASRPAGRQSSLIASEGLTSEAASPAKDCYPLWPCLPKEPEGSSSPARRFCSSSLSCPALLPSSKSASARVVQAPSMTWPAGGRLGSCRRNAAQPAAGLQSVIACSTKQPHRHSTCPPTLEAHSLASAGCQALEHRPEAGRL